MLNATVNKALAIPEVIERFGNLGVIPAPSTAEAFGTFIREDQSRWGKVIRDAKITLE